MHKIVSIKIMMDTIFHLSEAHLKMRAPDAYPQDAFTGCLHCCCTTGGPQNNNTPKTNYARKAGLVKGSRPDGCGRRRPPPFLTAAPVNLPIKPAGVHSG